MSYEYSNKITENSSIRIEWSDDTFNYTSERKNRIIDKIKEKYGTNRVSVVFKPLVTNGDDLTLSGDNKGDLLEQIKNPDYQYTLFNEWLNANNIEVTDELTHGLRSLDKRVTTIQSQNRDEHFMHRRWSLDKIEFSNFLSFGDENVINYDGLRGITTISSYPENFGGKTNLAIELILFLFFNKTLKSSKAEDIFNIYRNDCNIVQVKGWLTIDGEEYSIERILKRKQKRDGSYTVTQELNYYKVFGGDEELLNDEHRPATEKLINGTIGSYDDFLLTILATSDNLEDLVNDKVTKATKRGELLERFVGLSFIDEKEKIVKELYSTWKGTRISNTYNLTTLHKELDETKNEIERLKILVLANNEKIQLNEETLEMAKETKDTLLSSKGVIDSELIKYDEDELMDKVEKILGDIQTKESDISKIDAMEDIDETDLDNIDVLREEKDELISSIASMKRDCESIQTNIKQLRKNAVCFNCKRPYDDSHNHEAEAKKMEKKLETNKKKLIKMEERKDVVSEEISNLESLRKKIEEQYKLKLKKSKIELDIENLKNEGSKVHGLLKKYRENEQIINDNKEKDLEISKLISKINAIGDTLRELHSVIAKSETKIETLEGNIPEYVDKIKKIKQEEKTDKIFKLYVSMMGRSGIGKLLMKRIIPVINVELNRLLDDTTEFTLELEINEKNQIDFVMTNRENGVKNLLRSGSGFEKTISSLALRCILAKVNTLPKPNFIVLDEVFGKIADSNLDLVYDFFQKISNNFFDNIFIISHKQQVVDWGDNLIMLKKTNNISEVIV